MESDAFFQHESSPLFINHECLNYLECDLYQFIEKAEVSGSRLPQYNLLEPVTTILSFCSRNQNLAH